MCSPALDARQRHPAVSIQFSGCQDAPKKRCTLTRDRHSSFPGRRRSCPRRADKARQRAASVSREVRSSARRDLPGAASSLRVSASTTPSWVGDDARRGERLRSGRDRVRHLGVQLPPQPGKDDVLHPRHTRDEPESGARRSAAGRVRRHRRAASDWLRRWYRPAGSRGASPLPRGGCSATRRSRVGRGEDRPLPSRAIRSAHHTLRPRFSARPDDCQLLLPQAQAHVPARGGGGEVSRRATRSTRPSHSRFRRGPDEIDTSRCSMRIRGRCGFPRRSDGIITSPPYPGLIDYHEQHRYAYELLGSPRSSRRRDRSSSTRREQPRHRRHTSRT